MLKVSEKKELIKSLSNKLNETKKALEIENEAYKKEEDLLKEKFKKALKELKDKSSKKLNNLKNEQKDIKEEQMKLFGELSIEKLSGNVSEEEYLEIVKLLEN